MIKELQVRMDNLKISDKVTIMNKDILSIDLPKFDVFIANIPYQISSPLIMKLLNAPFNWKYATILLQEEFAQRLFSSPNSKFYGRISVMTQTFVTVRSIIKVTKQNFRPQPKVDSRFVKLIQHKEKSNIFIPEYEKFLTICFNRKHKLLKNLFHNHSFLTSFASPDKMFNTVEIDKVIDEVLNEMKMDKKRAAELTVTDFQDLLSHFHKKGIYFSKKHPDLHLDDNINDSKDIE